LFTQKGRSVRNEILAAAMELSSKSGGFSRMTRDAVAKRAGVAAGLVTYYFGGMPGLRTAVVRKAVADENLAVLGEAIALGHAVARQAPDALRSRAVKQLTA
jgi:AcrR family transcriptional regulator